MGNDYGMPLEEVLERLRKFQETEECKNWTDNFLTTMQKIAQKMQLSYYDFLVIKYDVVEPLAPLEDDDFVNFASEWVLGNDSLVGFLNYKNNLIFYSLKVFKYKDYILSFDEFGTLFIDTFRTSDGSLEYYIEEQNLKTDECNILFCDDLERERLCKEINYYCKEFDEFEELYKYSIFSKSEKAYVINQAKITELVKNDYFGIC